MKGQSFRLKTPTLGILSSDHGHRRPGTIPMNAIVTVVDGPFDNSNRLVDVLWEEKTIMMFTQDLRDRGEMIEGVAWGA